MQQPLKKKCKENGLVILGKIPYDPIFTKAQINETNIIEYKDSKVRDELINVFDKLNKTIQL